MTDAAGPTSELLSSAAREILDKNEYKPVVTKEEAARTSQHGPGAKPLPENVRLEDQNFGVIALLSPMNTKTASRRVLVSFRGAFPTQKSAESYVDTVLHPADPDVDHYVISLWQWGFLPPSKSHVMQMDTKYHDPEVERHMKGYFDSIQRGKDEVRARRKKAVKTAKAEATGKRLDAAARENMRNKLRRDRAKPVWTPDQGKMEEID